MLVHPRCPFVGLHTPISAGGYASVLTLVLVLLYSTVPACCLGLLGPALEGHVDLSPDAPHGLLRPRLHLGAVRALPVGDDARLHSRRPSHRVVAGVVVLVEVSLHGHVDPVLVRHRGKGTEMLERGVELDLVGSHVFSLQSCSASVFCTHALKRSRTKCAYPPDLIGDMDDHQDRPEFDAGGMERFHWVPSSTKTTYIWPSCSSKSDLYLLPPPQKKNSKISKFVP